MSFKRKVASSLVLSLGITSVVASPLFAESISDLQDEQATIKNSIEEKQGELDSNSSQKSETVAKIKEISDSINPNHQKIASFTSQISDQEAAIAETNAQITETEAKLAKAQESLNDRLVTIYKDGNVNYLEVLFQSEDFSDFLTRFEYLSYITKRDKNLVEEVKSVKAQLETQKATLEQQLASLNALKSEEEGVKALLEEQQSQQESVYAELEKDEAAIKETIAAMQATSDEIGKKIADLQAQEEAKRAAAAAAANQSNGAVTAAAADASSYEVTSAGSGVWPAPASHTITSNYGGRSYPLDGSYNYHLGTDIGASYGTPVVSYQAGTVLIASYHWSYGNYVVVDHGNGLSTLYAHMSALTVSAGQSVSAGQQVGLVGSTGSSTGPHLHFEVRINGSNVDPAPYLGI